MAGRIIVITGASGGIGAAAAELFTQKGDTVCCLNRSDGGIGVFIKTDITDEESVAAAFNRIKDEYGHIDVLVNNAGIGISGAVEYTDIAEAKSLFNVNFFGMLTCVKYAAELLRPVRGRIINISSAAAVFAIPFQALYSASKSSVNSLTLALANELKQFGITVCALMPGDVRTGFTAARRKSGQGEDVYGGKINNSVSLMEKDEQNGMTPQYIAGIIYKLSVKRRVKPLYTAGIKYKLVCFASKLLPARFVNLVVGKMYIK